MRVGVAILVHPEREDADTDTDVSVVGFLRHVGQMETTARVVYSRELRRAERPKNFLSQRWT